MRSLSLLKSLVSPTSSCFFSSIYLKSSAFSTNIAKDPSHMASPQEPPYTELERDFLEPEDFYNLLISKGIDFFTGVPDSLLKDFCGYVADHSDAQHHVITANEGNAVALATGYNLATGKFPLVYLQNSGLGNIVNPIMSLAHAQVYSIPMLLLIGWRGEPGKKDEPQHIVQGKCMNGILTEMGIQYEVLPDFIEGATQSVESAIFHMQKRSSPYALIVRRQCFVSYKFKNKASNTFPLSREDALKVVVENIGPHDVVVGTTGFLSRELYEIRAARGEGHERDFLCVGSMGHASSIALGVAISKPSRNVYCLDGDGACIMHMGTMTTAGSVPNENFKHILFNNGCHDSVGAQPTAGFDVNFPKIAQECGYKTAFSVSEKEELAEGVRKLASVKGPAFMEVKIRPGARKDLGRPKSSPLKNKTDFINFLKK